jgi:hypothetical protein
MYMYITHMRRPQLDIASVDMLYPDRNVVALVWLGGRANRAGDEAERAAPPQRARRHCPDPKTKPPVRSACAGVASPESGVRVLDGRLSAVHDSP